MEPKNEKKIGCFLHGKAILRVEKEKEETCK